MCEVRASVVPHSIHHTPLALAVLQAHCESCNREKASILGIDGTARSQMLTRARRASRVRNDVRITAVTGASAFAPVG